MNFDALLKQAQKLEDNNKREQAKFAKTRITSSSGGGMVKVVISGEGKIVKLEIEKSVIDPEDSELLADLIIAAVNDAQGKLAAERDKQLNKAAANLDLEALDINLDELSKMLNS